MLLKHLIASELECSSLAAGEQQRYAAPTPANETWTWTINCGRSVVLFMRARYAS